MKHNWTYKKLGELVDVLNGFAFKSSNYVKDGIRVIRIANVQKGKIVDEAPAFYPLSAESGLTRYMLHEDDILLSLTGNVGRVGLLPKEMLPAALNQRVACLRIKDDTLMFKFLYQFLNSDYFEQKCIESSRGIAQLNMSTEWLKDYPLPIPSLDEQQAIVRELDGINHLINLQEEQLREYDRLAQSLFYTTFGDPATNPKGWEVKSLGDIAEPTTGITYSPDDVVDDGIIVLRSSNIQDNKLDFEDVVRVKKNVAEKYYVKAGDILMCSRNGSFRLVGKTAMVDNLSEKMTWGAFMTIIRSDYNPYLLQYFRAPAFREQLTTAKTTTVNQITIGMLKKIQLPIPPADLQQSFAAQIEAIEQQKTLIRRSLDETRTLLAARMQYYFE